MIGRIEKHVHSQAKKKGTETSLQFVKKIFFFECLIQGRKQDREEKFKKNETETRPEDLRKCLAKTFGRCEDF